MFPSLRVGSLNLLKVENMHNHTNSCTIMNKYT
jgi:hypothetical protein